MKIAVLVSGGVDSSVALALLKEQGHDVTAFYLKIWLEDELSYLGNCPWEDDLEYVRKVCAQFAVPLEVVSMQQAYWQKVVAYTIAEVKAGRTPNPDVLCNQQVKFGAFYDHIADGYDYVATGHYAQVEHLLDYSLLKRAPDPIKDQTYFLCQLSQQQLRRVLFPIGHLQKFEVRQLAEQFDLPNKSRKDSQGICFLGKFKFSDFLRAHLGDHPGNLVEFETGEIIGSHLGFWYYTIGQRQGIGLSGGPWYVVDKNAAQNTVFISCHYQQAVEHKKGLVVKNMNWIIGFPSNQSELLLKYRHGADMHPVTVSFENDAWVIRLHQESKQGIAAGQFAVLYDNEICLGGGVIDKAF
ncbi:tRNA 2-thiouridine(34) synthase MnmA [Candidatus Babeliales bacterium]|nr:tRNA 2-thiouridine(34) synthase MnmA [Candidatus Babeliales bacterium]MBP9843837.1 tRNA 2-thiouridine(34) synthase MnmA [Candidatus Babeliales bacterium]